MTRRELFFAAGFGSLTACGRKKGTGYPGYALVATAGENSVAVVDLTAFKLLKSIQLSAPPTAVVPAQNRRKSYVLTPSDGTVHAINEKLQPAGQRKLADTLSEIRFSASGSLIALAEQSRELLELDPDTISVKRRHRLGIAPVNMDVSLSGQAAMSGGKSGSVELLDFATGSLRTVNLGSELGEIRFRTDGKALFAAKVRERYLSILSVPDLELIAELPLGMEPRNLCVKPDGGQLFISGPGMDAIAIVFLYQFEVEQTVLAGRDPGTMTCADAPYSYLFVGSESGSDVAILDVDTRKVIGLVQVGQRPRFIAVTPDNQYALVLDEKSGDMAVIRIPGIRINRDRTGAALFTLLPVGEAPVHVAVVQRA